MKLPRAFIILTTLAITANLTAVAYADDASPSSDGQSRNFHYLGFRSHGDPVNEPVLSNDQGSSSDLTPVADQFGGDQGWLNRLSASSNSKTPNGYWLATGSPANNPISCHNSCQTLTGTIALIPVWVGNWATADVTNWSNVLGNIVTSLGGAAANSVAVPGHVFNTNSLYFTSQSLTPPSLQWVQNTDITDPTTTSVSNYDVVTHINNFITAHPGIVPAGTSPVYIYIGANSTLLTSGFGTTYCGWHTYGASNWAGLANVPFIAFQDFTSAYNKACAPQTTSPNGSASLDAMASVMAHEVDETLTDPFLGAWYDVNGAESADKCVRTYGTLYSIGTARYNVQLGSLKYLIQQNWLENNIVTATGNSSGNACSVTG